MKEASGAPGGDDIYRRLHKLEESQARQEMTLERIEEDLKAINENLKLLTEIQLEQVRSREEMRAQFEKAHSAAIRAHERIDKIEANLSRAMWVVLTVVIAGVIAGKAFIGG